MMISKLSSFMIAFITFSAAQAGGEMVLFTGGNANNNSKERSVAIRQNSSNNGTVATGKEVEPFQGKNTTKNSIFSFFKKVMELNLEITHLPKTILDKIYNICLEETKLDSDDLFEILNHTDPFVKNEGHKITVENEKVYLSGKEYQTRSKPYKNLYHSYKVGRMLLKWLLKKYIFYISETKQYTANSFNKKNLSEEEKEKLKKQKIEDTQKEILKDIHSMIGDCKNSAAQQNTFIVLYALYKEFILGMNTDYDHQFRHNKPQDIADAIQILKDNEVIVDEKSRKEDVYYYLDHPFFNLRAQALYCLKTEFIQKIIEENIKDWQQKVANFKIVQEGIQGALNTIESSGDYFRKESVSSYDSIKIFESAFIYNGTLNKDAEKQAQESLDFYLQIIINALQQYNLADIKVWAKSLNKFLATNRSPEPLAIEYILDKESGEIRTEQENRLSSLVMDIEKKRRPTALEEAITLLGSFDYMKLGDFFHEICRYIYDTSLDPLILKLKVFGFLPRVWVEPTSMPFIRPLGVYPNYITIAKLANLIAEDFNLDITQENYINSNGNTSDDIRANFLATIKLYPEGKKVKKDKKDKQNENNVEDEKDKQDEKDINSKKAKLVDEIKKDLENKKKAYILNTIPASKEISLDADFQDKFVQIYKFILHRVLRRLKEHATYYSYKTKGINELLNAITNQINSTILSLYNNFAKNCKEPTENDKLEAWIERFTVLILHLSDQGLNAQEEKEFKNIATEIDANVDETFCEKDVFDVHNSERENFKNKYYRWYSAIEIFKQTFISDNLYLMYQDEFTAENIHSLLTKENIKTSDKELFAKLESLFGDKTEYYIAVFRDIIFKMRYKPIMELFLPRFTDSSIDESKLFMGMMRILNDVMNILDKHYDKEDLLEKIIEPDSLFYTIWRLLSNCLKDKYKLKNGDLYDFWLKNCRDNFISNLKDSIYTKDLRTDEEGIGFLKNKYTKGILEILQEIGLIEAEPIVPTTQEVVVANPPSNEAIEGAPVDDKIQKIEAAPAGDKIQKIEAVPAGDKIQEVEEAPADEIDTKL